MLNTTIHGQPTDRTALLIVHGLYGSGRNWGVIAKRLSDTRQVIAVDMRNHGESGWTGSHTYADMAADLAEIIEYFGAPMDVLGHSMGGKASMVLAVSQPSLLRRLVVADIAPVTYDHTQIHLIEAMREIGAAHDSRGDADTALAAHVDSPGVRSFLLQSLDIKEKRWRLNLDVLATYMDDVLGFPALEGQFDGPVLFLSGADSNYVQREHRPEIKRLFPHSRFAKIPGAGHWLHAEKPREFEAAARAFLDA